MGKSWLTDQGQGVFIQELRELIEQYGPSFGEKILNFLINNKTIPESYHEAFRVSSLSKRRVELEDRVVTEMVRNDKHKVKWLQKHTDKATGQLRHANPRRSFFITAFCLFKKVF